MALPLLDIHQQTELLHTGIQAVGSQVLAYAGGGFRVAAGVRQEIHLCEVVEFLAVDAGIFATGLPQGGCHRVVVLGLQKNLAAHQLASGTEVGRVGRCRIVCLGQILQGLPVVTLRIERHPQGEVGGSHLCRIMQSLGRGQLAAQIGLLHGEEVFPLIGLGKSAVQTVAQGVGRFFPGIVGRTQQHRQRAVFQVGCIERSALAIQPLHHGGGVGPALSCLSTTGCGKKCDRQEQGYGKCLGTSLHLTAGYSFLFSGRPVSFRPVYRYPAAELRATDVRSGHKCQGWKSAVWPSER